MSARRHADNMLTSFVGNFYPALVALITGPILAHALGVFGRGQVAGAQAPLALISTIATFGIPEAVTFAVAASPLLARLALRHAVWILASAGTIGVGVIIAASTWLSGENPETRHLILIAAIAVVPTLLLGAIRGIAAASQSWRRIAVERIGAATMRLAVILVLWPLGLLTPVTATIVLAAMPLFGALAYIGLPALRRVADMDSVDKTPGRPQALTSYGLRVWLGSISGVVLSRIDQVLMTGLSSSSALGLYVVAVTVSELPLMINSAVRDVTFATDAAQPQDARLATSARVSFFVCLIAALGVGTTMLWWLPALFGDAFTDALPVAAILLLAVVLGTPGSVAGAGLSARGRPGLRSAGLLIASVVNIAVLLALVPPLGAIGAAIATLVGNIISSNFNLFALRRHFGMRVADFYIVRPADVHIVWAFALRLLRPRRRDQG